MADEIQISPDSVERTAKIRHPVAVPVLTLITLGIYGLYWWYQVNREMADLGRARGVEGLGEKPIWSLLAVFPGLLVIIPPYVSLYNGVKRIQRAQETTTGEVSMNGWIVLIMVVGSLIVGVVGLLIPGYIQAELNKVWEDVGSGGPAAPASAPAGDQVPGAP
jgi:Domain of unknown function (DUF4234)